MREMIYMFSCILWLEERREIRNDPQDALFPRPHDVAVFRVIASSSRKKKSGYRSATRRVTPNGDIKRLAFARIASVPSRSSPPFMGRAARSLDKPNTAVRCLDLVDKAFPGSRGSIGQYGSLTLKREFHRAFQRWNIQPFSWFTNNRGGVITE